MNSARTCVCVCMRRARAFSLISRTHRAGATRAREEHDDQGSLTQMSRRSTSIPGARVATRLPSLAPSGRSRPARIGSTKQSRSPVGPLAVGCSGSGGLLLVRHGRETVLSAAVKLGFSALESRGGRSQRRIVASLIANARSMRESGDHARACTAWVWPASVCSTPPSWGSTSSM